MPIAVVLRLRPVQEAELPRSHGAMAYACALDLFLRLDPALSLALHQRRGAQAFTTAPLRGTFSSRGGSIVVSTEELYSWRLTGLSSVVEETLAGLQPQVGALRLGPAVFRIEQVIRTAEENPEAGAVSYEALLQQWWRVDEPSATLTLHLVTPTAFRVNRWELPFPLPVLLFPHLQGRWGAFSPIPLPVEPDIEQFRRGVLISNWWGKTRRVELGDRRTVGCIGRFTFREVTRDPDLRRLMGLLGDLAFFSGVGWQTAYGMGQTRTQGSKSYLYGASMRED